MHSRLKKIIGNPAVLFFSLAWFFYLLNTMILTTVLKYQLSGGIVKLISILCITFCIFKIIFFTKYKYREVILIFSIITVSFLVQYYSGYNELIVPILLIIGAKGIDLKFILKEYLLIVVPSLIIIATLAKFDILLNLVYSRGNGIFRNSLGTLYPTNFAARIFFITLSYAYLKKFEFKIIDIIGIVFLGIFTINETDGRLDMFSMFLIFLITLIVFRRKKFQKYISLISIIIPPIFAIITFLASKYYNPSNIFQYKMNILLSDRLRLGNLAFYRYDPFTIFGQNIYVFGNGGINGLNRNNAISEYFFLDSAYLDILFRFGLLTLIIILLLITFSSIKQWKEDNYLIVLVMALMGVYFSISGFMLTPGYFPFIFYLTAKVNENPILSNELLQERKYLEVKSL